MEDVFDSAWQSPPPISDATIEAELATLVDVHGLSLFEKPDQIRRVLTQAGPGAQPAVEAILLALSVQVPQRLRAAEHDDGLADLLRLAARDVQAAGTLTEDRAAWAVDAWAHALALPTAGTRDAVSPVVTDPSAAGERSMAVAPWMTALGTTPARPRASFDAAGRRASADSALRHEPLIGRDTSEGPAPLRGDAVHEGAAGALLVEPLFPDRPAQDETPDEHDAAFVTEPPVLAEQPRADAAPWTSDESIVPPTWDRRPDAASKGIGRTAAIVAALVAVVLVWFFGVDGLRRPSDTVSATAQRPPTVALPTPAAPTADATRPGNPASDAVARPAAPTEDGPATASRTDTMAPSAAPSVEAPRDPPEPLPTTPVPAPSGPPVLQRPVIVAIDVPDVVEGAPFAVAVRLAGDTRDVASVERRIDGRTGTWPRSGALTVAAGLQRSGSHVLLVPFRALDAPAIATVDFTVIGRDGSRSDARRATIALAATSRPLPDSAITAACTRDTCGSVAMSREIEPAEGIRAAVYEVTVRMDDQESRSFRGNYRLQTGSRVRLVDGRVLPLVDGAR